MHYRKSASNDMLWHLNGQWLLIQLMCWEHINLGTKLVEMVLLLLLLSNRRWQRMPWGHCSGWRKQSYIADWTTATPYWPERLTHRWSDYSAELGLLRLIRCPGVRCVTAWPRDAYSTQPASSWVLPVRQRVIFKTALSLCGNAYTELLQRIRNSTRASCHSGGRSTVASTGCVQLPRLQMSARQRSFYFQRIAGRYGAAWGASGTFEPWYKCQHPPIDLLLLLTSGRTWMVHWYSTGGASVRRHLIHASLDPPMSTSKMAFRSVQPFLHSSRQCPGACPGMSFPPKRYTVSRQNCPFVWDDLDP